MEFHKRLQYAIDNSPYDSKRAFAERMKEVCKERGIRGWSYPMINRYTAGTYTPKADWIEVAARELGVRRPWLENGQGVRLPALQAVFEFSGLLSPKDERQAGKISGETWWSEDQVEAVQEAAPTLCGEEAAPGVETAFWNVLTRYCDAVGDEAVGWEGVAQVAKKLEETVQAPVEQFEEAIRKSDRSDGSEWRRNQYYVSALHAIASLF